MSTYSDQEIFVQSHFERDIFQLKSSKSVLWIACEVGVVSLSDAFPTAIAGPPKLLPQYAYKWFIFPQTPQFTNSSFVTNSTPVSTWTPCAYHLYTSPHQPSVPYTSTLALMSPVKFYIIIAAQAVAFYSPLLLYFQQRSSREERFDLHSVLIKFSVTIPVFFIFLQCL